MDYSNISDALAHDFTEKLFPAKYQLLPNLDDVYELRLAHYESQILSDKALLRNGAYFARVGNTFTRHFLMCTGESLKLPEHSSSRLKSFFEKNLFRTGYATHGLFPYRGKFHPQMIKGLINIMGLRPGDTLLDPMMGSGTALVEASLMGIKSIGIDASPFCRFMTQTKIDTLTMSLNRAKKALSNYKEVFEYFRRKPPNPAIKSKVTSKMVSPDMMSIMEPAAEYALKQDRNGLTKKQRETSDTYNFLLLAFLDSVGYSERSQRKTPLEQFKAVLERYLFVAEKIQNVLKGFEQDIAPAKALEGDARYLPLENAALDGIIFSPPYSFAIDYLKNDEFHLNFFGVETERLRESMIGLRGRKMSDKFQIYNFCGSFNYCHLSHYPIDIVIFSSFFVYKIHNTIIKIDQTLVNMDKNLYVMASVLQKQNKVNDSKTIKAEDQLTYKICKNCGGKNRKEDVTCTHCSKLLA